MKSKAVLFLLVLCFLPLSADRVLAQDSASEEEVLDEWSEVDDRIRLSYHFGAWFFSGNLDLKPNFATGVRFNYEVPGMVGVSLEYGWTRTDMDIDQDIVKQQTHITAFGDLGEQRDDLWGNLHHTALYVTLNNTDLSTDDGMVETWMGFGFGAFIRDDFETRFANDPLIGVTTSYNADGYMLHFSTTVEVNVNLSEVMGFGILWREHLVFQNEQFDDDMNIELEDDFLDSVVSEIGLHFSVRF